MRVGKKRATYCLGKLKEKKREPCDPTDLHCQKPPKARKREDGRSGWGAVHHSERGAQGTPKGPMRGRQSPTAASRSALNAQRFSLCTAALDMIRSLLYLARCTPMGVVKSIAPPAMHSPVQVLSHWYRIHLPAQEGTVRLVPTRQLTTTENSYRSLSSLAT